MSDLLRSTAFRWAFGIALWSMLFAMALFAFVYWQTAAFMREELAETIRLEIRAAVNDPAAAATRIDTWIAMDPHATHYGALFAPDGTRRLGNLKALPEGMPRDGEAYRVAATVAIGIHTLHDEIWAGAWPFRTATSPSSGTMPTRSTGSARRPCGPSASAGPTLALAMAGGLVLAVRGRRRLAATEAALAQVTGGDLRQRLPVGPLGDEFDRLAGNVNRMLDKIEHLMGEVRSVGDAVAHDLRTP